MFPGLRLDNHHADQKHFIRGIRSEAVRRGANVYVYLNPCFSLCIHFIKCVSITLYAGGYTEKYLVCLCSLVLLLALCCAKQTLGPGLCFLWSRKVMLLHSNSSFCRQCELSPTSKFSQSMEPMQPQMILTLLRSQKWTETKTASVKFTIYILTLPPILDVETISAHYIALRENYLSHFKRIPPVSKGILIECISNRVNVYSQEGTRVSPAHSHATWANIKD